MKKEKRGTIDQNQPVLYDLIKNYQLSFPGLYYPAICADSRLLVPLFCAQQPDALCRLLYRPLFKPVPQVHTAYWRHVGLESALGVFCLANG